MKNNILLILCVLLCLSLFGQDPVFTNPTLTPYNVNQFIPSGNKYSVSEEENITRGIAYNTSGTKLFLIGNDGDAVVEYGLTSAFDISTISHSGVGEEFYVGNQFPLPLDLAFNTDGTKMFVLGSVGGGGYSVAEYDLSIAFVVSTATYAGAIEDLIVDQDINLSGMAFNSSGSKLYIIGQTDHAVIEFELSIPFDVSTGTHNGLSEEFIIGDEGGMPSGITFNASGDMMFIIGAHNRNIARYELSVEFDVSTASYGGYANDLFIGKETRVPYDMIFSSDGTKMFVLDASADAIVSFEAGLKIEYNESSATEVFDVDADDGFGGATDAVSYSISGEDGALFSVSPTGSISFNSIPNFEDPEDSDLDNVYLITVIADNFIEQAALAVQIRVVDIHDTPVFTSIGQGFSLPFSSHSGASEEFFIGLEENRPNDILFNSDGTRLFVLGDRDRSIVQYAIHRAYDVSSATYLGASEEFHIEETFRPVDMVFNGDGSKMFVLGNVFGAVFEYNLSSSFDSSTAVWAGAEENLDVSDLSFPRSISFNPEGTRLYILVSSLGKIITYDLSVPFDVSTGVRGDDIDDFNEAAGAGDFSFSNDGNKLYILRGGSNIDSVWEYDLSSPYDVASADFFRSRLVEDIESIPTSIVFTPDGTKMILVGYSELSAIEFRLPTNVSIVENSSSAVIDIDANDGAGGEEDQNVSYSLSGEDGDLFDIGADGLITFVDAPDFENPNDEDADNAYDFEVVVNNNFDEIRQRILVTLSDIDDTPPEFVSTSAVSVPEGTVGTIYTVEITDQTATVQLGNTKDENLFVFSAGDLHFSSTPDFELPLDQDEDNQYLVDFVATDSLGNSIVLELSITVADLDEISPIFTSAPSIAVDENAAGIIYYATADEEVVFSLGTEKDESYFVFEESALSLLEAPNYESPGDQNLDNEYLVDLIATDPSGNSSTFELSITVADLDEISPIFTSAPSITIDENLVGIIYYATANEVVVFSLGTEKDESHFAFEESSLSLLSSVDFEAPADQNLDNEYLIDLIATDPSGNSSTFELSITVADLDEIFPIFTSAPSVTIDENEVGVIYYAIANEDVTFSLGTTKDEAALVLTENALSLIAPPDFEVPTDQNLDNEYLIDLIATDSSGNSSTFELSITVADLDEISPFFTSAPSIAVDENAAGIIYYATADEEVVFSLGTEKDESHFVFEESALSLLEAPNYELPGDQNLDNEYLVDLIATDPSGNSSTFELSITVADLDEISPIFTSAPSITIDENLVGIIYYATANEVVVFSLGTEKDESHFAFEESSLSLLSSVDFEAPADQNLDNEYLIDLIATDPSGNSSTFELSITVADLDEVSPTFTSAPSATVDENIEGIFYYVTTDEEIIFSLGNEKDERSFVLEESSLSFQSSPDFEAPEDQNQDNEYEIDIIATDAAQNSSVLELRISVRDVNEEVLSVISAMNRPIIFPNPSSEAFSIVNAQSLSFTKVLLKSLEGKTVMEFQKSSTGSYGITDLQSGTYLLMIQSESYLVTLGKLVRR